MVHEVEQALAEARAARDRGADLVEYRLDQFFHGEDTVGDRVDADDDAADDRSNDVGDYVPALKTLESQIEAACDLVSRSPVACIATCRPTWEGGFYDGPEDARVALFEALGTLAPPRGHAPRYIDFEQAGYARSANIRQKIHLAVDHPTRGRDLAPSLILSIHDFKGPPADLSRRLLAARGADAARVLKVAFHARSLRDNIELFDILTDRDRPTIALCMGEFGLMSRVLAPKFGGFLTFASLRPTTTTAPGQPTIAELVGLYRFRSIGARTRVYGIVGWPVGHSLSPHVHNAGFEAVGHDGVYVPLPIAADARTDRDEPTARLVETGRPAGSSPEPDASYVSFKATMLALLDHPNLTFSGCSVTIPHKQNLVRLAREQGWSLDALSAACGAGNTLVVDRDAAGPPRTCRVLNTDGVAATRCVEIAVGGTQGTDVGVIGAGGAARAIVAACALAGARVTVFARRVEQARQMAEELIRGLAARSDEPGENMTARARAAQVTADRAVAERVAAPGFASESAMKIASAEIDSIASNPPAIIINATPVGMIGGPASVESPVDVAAIARARPDAVFFDTVYRPLETPMLAAARAAGCRVVTGLEMFTTQAAAQFEAWTGTHAPLGLFDRVAREAMGGVGQQNGIH